MAGEAPGPVTMLEWSVAERPIAGETQSGDLHVVGAAVHQVIVGVIDGLGHGPEAAVAASSAAATILQHAAQPLVDVALRCHEALRQTRGAALSLAAFSRERPTMTWLGIGNVEGILFRCDANASPRRESLLARGGVVGYRLPALRCASVTVQADDTLIFATDGIRPDFSTESPLGRPARDVADAILARYAKAADDALVLVVRYRGIGA